MRLSPLDYDHKLKVNIKSEAVKDVNSFRAEELMATVGAELTGHSIEYLPTSRTPLQEEQIRYNCHATQLTRTKP